MRRRLKVTVAFILCLGIVYDHSFFPFVWEYSTKALADNVNRASVSALVRLNYTVNLSAATNFMWKFAAKLLPVQPV